jgi:uncharacterized protein YjbI with pentapeptide repeats
MERILIHKEKKQIDASEFDLEDSHFQKGSLSKSRFENIMMTGITIFDVNASKMTIVNANLSDLEIEGAQMGGAFIHNIGMPPKDHPMHVEGSSMRPVKFEDCNLSKSTFHDCNLSAMEISDCNLSGAALKDCNLTGMTIDGIPVQELLAAYKADRRGI